MAKNRYYLVKEDLSHLSRPPFGGVQLKEGQVIEDVGTNMFIAKSIGGAITKQFQQLDGFEMDLVRMFIKHKHPSIKDVT